MRGEGCTPREGARRGRAEGVAAQSCPPGRWPGQAWVLLPSGRRLDLLAPTPFDWSDEDLVLGLARTHRWGGHSRWPLPLSVAQHSLAVLVLRRQAEGGRLPADEARRELLHDAEEGLLGFDCIAPLKPFLGERFAELERRLRAAVAARYAPPGWTPGAWRAYKAADLAMATAEAVHVAGWSPAEVRTALGLRAEGPSADPLAEAHGGEPWRPWPAETAAERFLAALRGLSGPTSAPAPTGGGRP